MPEPTFMQRLLREKTLSRYLTALERGDIDTIIATLRQSSNDATLEQMIFELHETYQTEEEFLAMVQEEQEMDFKEGIHKSLPQGRLGEIPWEEMSELQEAIIGPAFHRPSRYARWFQVLAAVLLMAFLGGGVLLYTRLHNPGTTQTAGPQYRWCTSTGAQLGAMSYPQFNGIAAIAPDDVWLVGNLTLQTKNPSLIEHWNGKTWSVVHDVVSSKDSASLNSLDALSANDIWAVGGTTIIPGALNNYTYTQNPLIERWNGQQWQMIPGLNVPGPGDSWLNAVSASSDSDVWAIGGVYNSTNSTSSQHLLVHWDGSHWSTPQLPAAFQNGTIMTVKALAPNDVWIAGSTAPNLQNTSQGKPLIAYWNGQNWTVTPLPGKLSSITGVFSNLTALSASDIWVVGGSGDGFNASTVILRWNGSQWTQMATPTTVNARVFLKTLVANGATSVWALGSIYNNDTNASQLLIEHWNGQNWSIALQQSAQAQDGGKSLSGITFSGAKIWVIGDTYKSSTVTNPFIETNC